MECEFMFSFYSLGKFMTKLDNRFRWVDCQFLSLASCPSSQRHLKKALNSLPRSLDETYNRMLMNIDPDQLDDAKRILTWLCFSKRPVTMQEIVEGLAVDIAENPRLDLEGRLEDTDDIIRICPGLISISTIDDTAALALGQAVQSPVVRIAHFSVQEYLESDRIKSRHFALLSRTANTELAKICIVYLRYVELKSLDDYPLALYAARHWHEHLLDGDEESDSLHLLVTDFLLSTDDGIGRSIKLHDLEGLSRKIDFDRPSASHIYYASLLGLCRPLQTLLEDNSIRSTINDRSGQYGTALTVASDSGHEHIVRILLENGLEGASLESALHRASWRGHEKVVQLLLDNGADIDYISDRNQNALVMASQNDHEKVVKLLIDRGAEMNAQEGFHYSPLQIASSQGHGRIVRLLLENGAENAQGGHMGSALQAASAGGDERIVRLLLESGAEVNALEGFAGCALRVASLTGNEQIVQLLLDGGADIDAQGGADITTPGLFHGTALQAAFYEGNEQMMQLLLDRGAKDDGSLYEAAAGGRVSMMQRLLDKGFEIGTSKAIQTASMTGNAEMVQMLLELDRGSEITNDVVNISTEGYLEVPVQLQLGRSPDLEGERIQATIHVVSEQGNTDVVQVVLNKGFKLDSSVMGKALRRAAYTGQREVTQMLLDSGIKIDSRDIGVALMMASRDHNIEVVQLLLERGFTTVSKVVEAAIGAAVNWGSEEVVEVLLDTDVDIDTSEAIEKEALQLGYEKVVRLFLDSDGKTDVKIMEVALEKASGWGHEEVVKMLLDTGAEINTSKAIELATKRDNTGVVKILLARDAKVDTSKAIELALKRGHKKTLQVLREHSMGSTML
jgi:ankyrin repeat protein